MKTTLIQVVGAIAAVCVSAGPARATLVDFSDVTLDTGTGLEWLDVTKTQGMSYQDILAGVGGFHAEGWRSASWEQMTAVLATYVSDAPADRSLLGIFGVTFFQDSPTSDRYYTLGHFGENSGFASIFWYDFVLRKPETVIIDTTVSAGVGARALDPATPAHPIEGYWLVRPVPEPSTLTLMGLGALTLWRKKRR